MLPTLRTRMDRVWISSVIGYVAKGQTHLVKTWILHGVEDSVEDMARWAYELIPEECRDILDSYCREGMASLSTQPDGGTGF